MIVVDQLTKYYGEYPAVRGVSFEVPKGRAVGFLGPNGAGKSTTMRILAGFLTASSGKASIAGFDVFSDPIEVRRRIGYMPESCPLYPELRVDEYLRFRAGLKGLGWRARRKRLDYVTERCCLTDVRRQLIGTLSKGYRQRVGLADALLADPPVLILDEPLTGLDPVQQEETLGAIRGLGGKHTVLFSSHHLPDVEKVCDRVVIIDRGQIRFDGRLSDIRAERPTLDVEVRGPAADVEAFLRSQAGVTAVTAAAADDGATRFVLQTDGGRDPREELATALVGKGWGVRQLGLRRASLEDTFLKVVFRRG